MSKRYLFGIGVCVVTFFTSCTGSKTITHTLPEGQSTYCSPTVSYSHRVMNRPVSNFDSLSNAHPILNSYLSEHDRIMANALGITSAIAQLATMRSDTTVVGHQQYAKLTIEIQNRLLLAASEIDGIAAELDCEGERAEQLAHYLDNLNNKRSIRLTAASIIIGAAITIATAAVSTSDTQNAIGISGGLVTAVLGALILNPAGKKISIDYSHRNILHDIWFAPTSSDIYTPFVWYVLNEKKFSNSYQVALTQSIRTRWTNFEFDNAMDASKEELFFGHGGIYTAEDLHTRAAFLNQLQSTIRSIHQDMQSLHASIGNLYKIQD
ncbi:MAG TPA: hypothetical protein VL443_23525 [Cyclobacteriaceae bacterium]|nr:hypothetical protein [Cyclobacteriaceae bacterium]